MMNTIRMKEVPAVSLTDRSIIEISYIGPAMKGRGDINYVCCGCGQILLEEVAYKQIPYLTIRCRNCRKYNEIPRFHETH
jgi:hypothetical protein